MSRLLVLLGLIGVAPAFAAELRMVAPTNLTAPLVQFEQEQLRAGLLKDLGDALAAQLGRRSVYLSMPSKRVSEALQQGRADLVCYVMPGWLDGPLRWTQPVIPNAEVLAARPEAPAVKELAQLQGQRVGTVLGYRYPHLLPAGQEQLPFAREDAPDSRANLAKLAAGRVRYAIVDALALREFQRRQRNAGLRQDLVLSSYTAHCALGPKASLALDEVDAALSALQRDGRLARLLSAYD